jgi:K+-transporting ATPase ATPase C chain
MTSQLRPALTVLAGLSLVTGVLYPAAVTGLAQVLFPDQARGSLVSSRGEVRGSELIGQAFTSPAYFWGRPSATAPAHNAAASSGSNLGPLNLALADAVQARLDALRAADPGNESAVPVDLVTASGSGLDPHVSPAAALYQVPRVARARGLSQVAVEALVRAHTEGRDLGALGEPRVNVLLLNLALDSLAGGK